MLKQKNKVHLGVKNGIDSTDTIISKVGTKYNYFNTVSRVPNLVYLILPILMLYFGSILSEHFLQDLKEQELMEYVQGVVEEFDLEYVQVEPTEQEKQIYSRVIEGELLNDLGEDNDNSNEINIAFSSEFIKEVNLENNISLDDVTTISNDDTVIDVEKSAILGNEYLNYFGYYFYEKVNEDGSRNLVKYKLKDGDFHFISYKGHIYMTKNNAENIDIINDKAFYLEKENIFSVLEPQKELENKIAFSSVEMIGVGSTFKQGFSFTPFQYEITTNNYPNTFKITKESISDESKHTTNELVAIIINTIIYMIVITIYIAYIIIILKYLVSNTNGRYGSEFTRAYKTYTLQYIHTEYKFINRTTLTLIPLFCVGFIIGNMPYSSLLLEKNVGTSFVLIYLANVVFISSFLLFRHFVFFHRMWKPLPFTFRYRLQKEFRLFMYHKVLKDNYERYYINEQEYKNGKDFLKYHSRLFTLSRNQLFGDSFEDLEKCFTINRKEVEFKTDLYLDNLSSLTEKQLNILITNINIKISHLIKFEGTSELVTYFEDKRNEAMEELLNLGERKDKL